MTIKKHVDFFGKKRKTISKTFKNVELSMTITNCFEIVMITKYILSVDGTRQTANHICDYSHGIKNFNAMILKYKAIL